MLSSSDLRKGLRIELDGVPYVITEFNFVKPGKGASIYNCKMKNLMNGSTLNRSYRSNETFQEAKLEERAMRYSYCDGDQYVFMDQETYDQENVAPSALGDAADYMVENSVAVIAYYKGEIVTVEIPASVELNIADTEPGIQGDRVSGARKPATLETGKVIQVPLFVNVGDKLKVDTRSGEYITRA